MLSIQAAQENGTTMPVVPSTDSPPTMPSRPFSVFRASASPPGMPIVTSASGDGRTEASAASIMRRGPGLIAGSPGGSGSPGRVTVPTPGPAAKRTPLPAGSSRTSARTSAPCVTSGSSPASLTTPALATPSPARCSARAKLGVAPFGSAIATGSGKPPSSKAV